MQTAVACEREFESGASQRNKSSEVQQEQQDMSGFGISAISNTKELGDCKRILQVSVRRKFDRTVKIANGRDSYGVTTRHKIDEPGPTA